MNEHLVAGVASVAFLLIALLLRQRKLLKCSLSRIQVLETDLAQLEAVNTTMEQALRRERAAAQSFAADVDAYLHKCRHDLASALNVATGFLELMNQFGASDGHGHEVEERRRRALLALEKACRLVVQIPVARPALLIDDDRHQQSQNHPKPLDFATEAQTGGFRSIQSG